MIAAVIADGGRQHDGRRQNMKNARNFFFFYGGDRSEENYEGLKDIINGIDPMGYTVESRNNGSQGSDNFHLYISLMLAS